MLNKTKFTPFFLKKNKKKSKSRSSSKFEKDAVFRWKFSLTSEKKSLDDKNNTKFELKMSYKLTIQVCIFL